MWRNDPAARVAYGVAVGFDRELGYFSLNEIEGIRGKHGLVVDVL